MGRKSRRRAHRPLKPGLPPGSLVIEPGATPPQVNVTAYGPDGCEEAALPDLEQIRALRARHPVVWIDVEGTGDERTLRRLAELFGLHALAMEDVVNVHQRTKCEEYPDHYFIVTHMVSAADPQGEQLSVFLGRGFVLTFQERPGDPFHPVRERLRRGNGRIRSLGADYLAYALLDAVVDAWFPLLDAYGERLRALEEAVLTRPARRQIGEIREVKWELIGLRRSMLPLRDVFSALLRDPGGLLAEETRLYLRDCLDHAQRIVEETETYREVDDSLMELYQSSVSNRLNEVMKLLTVIAAIFIPLTFIAGVYGMNFDPDASPLNMPELRWYWGYPAALAVMLLIGAVMVFLFWRKGWFGDALADAPERDR